MDEVFGGMNFVVAIKFSKTSGLGGRLIDETFDYLIWFAKNIDSIKFRRPFLERVLGEPGATQYNFEMRSDGSIVALGGDGNGRALAHGDLTSQSGNETTIFPFHLNGVMIPNPSKGGWKSNRSGIERLTKAGRIIRIGNTPRYVRYFDDAPYFPMGSGWLDTGISGFGAQKTYVVQTHPRVIERCILMTSDPSDLVLDPTCGAGTTAYVAEQLGRRWITTDTSRVALALARARVMGTRYPYYLLADSTEGQAKTAEVERREPSSAATYGDIRQGFVYKRVPRITLRDIANNDEIDVIWERMQPRVESALADLNQALREEPAAPFTSPTGGREGQQVDFNAPDDATVTLPSGESAPVNGLLEWEVPRESPDDWPAAAEEPLDRFWKARIARQGEIDASIAAKAEFEYLYDKPYEDQRTVRVAGPFTVESLSPHRILGVDEHGELIDTATEATGRYGEPQDFATMILDNLRTAGVQQAHKEDRIAFDSLTPWPGDHVCAEGRYSEGRESGRQRRAGVFVGPEFGTVQRQDLVEAAREAAEAGFDVLIACAFNYEAQATEFDKLGRIPVLKARMNADLHMGGDLKNTGQGNLFVIFGEPDIDVLDADDDQVQVQVKGVDVFDPSSGEVRSDDTDGIACWFIDTDYDSESFFVRHAYFLGANDPYKSLKTTLKAEIDEEAWATLHSDTSRPFPKPESGRIAVKVINHLGDEVMKVFRVE